MAEAPAGGRRSEAAVRDAAHGTAHGDRSVPRRLRWRRFIDLICAQGVAPTPADYGRACGSGGRWWAASHWMDSRGLWHNADGLPVGLSGRVLSMPGRGDLPVADPAVDRGPGPGSGMGALDAGRRAYVEWEMTRPAEREQSKTELAASLGVTVQTLRRWAAEPAVTAYMNERVTAELTHPMMLVRMLWAIQSSLDLDEMGAVDRLLRYLGIVRPLKTAAGADMDSVLDGLSDAELDAEIAALAAER